MVIGWLEVFLAALVVGLFVGVFARAMRLLVTGLVRPKGGDQIDS